MSSNKESNMEQAKVIDDKNLQPDRSTHTGKDENNSNDIDPYMKIFDMMNVIMNEITEMKQNISSINEKITCQDKNNAKLYRSLQASFEENKEQIIKWRDQYTNTDSEYSKLMIKLDNNLKKLKNDIDVKFSKLDEKYKKLVEENRSGFSALYKIMDENQKELKATILELKKHYCSNEEVRKLKYFNESDQRILYGVKDLLVNNLSTND